MHQYDSLGRLIRDYASGPWWYYYDDSGNITRKWDMADRDISYEYTDSEWGDLLTKYDGTVISYGVLGNPLNWRNGMSFTWEHEKRLSEINQNGTQTASYNYDSAGLRSSKTVGGKTVTFEYVNNKLVYQTDGTNVWWFCYDTDGTLTALEYNGEIYYYVHDGIGNIIGLVDKNGSVAARYRYDGWGNIEGIIGINGSFDDVSADPTHIANINPFRYKDYYYDSESEFYYLITRYYDPFVGRFLSADGEMGVNNDLGTYNLFIYCGNNPVSRHDSAGKSWLSDLGEVLHYINNVAVDLGINTAAIGAFFLMMEEDVDGVYHSNQDCWQQYFGYNESYNYVFGQVTSMWSHPYEFTYNGCGYTIWVWKGDYINLGAGAELGIYRGSSGHRTVDRSLSMRMGMFVDYKGKNIVYYNPSEKQWWITSFNSNYLNVDANDLSVAVYIQFNDRGMFQAFRNKWEPATNWLFMPRKNIVIICY